MNRSDRDPTTGLSVDDPIFDVVLDLRIAAMHRLLDQMSPATNAAALKTLRDNFPDAPLAERVRALNELKH